MSVDELRRYRLILQIRLCLRDAASFCILIENCARTGICSHGLGWSVLYYWRWWIKRWLSHCKCLELIGLTVPESTRLRKKYTRNILEAREGILKILASGLLGNKRCRHCFHK